MNNKFISFLGICKKAGRLSAGFDQTVENIERKNAQLVLIARDLSENTKKKIICKCKDYRVEYIEINYSIDDIYSFLGKSSGIIAILDIGFSEKIKAFLNTNNLGGR